MDALVGCTGFVGGNLCAAHHFDAVYHSADVANGYGARPELLVYAGLRAEKYLANHAPEKDLAAVVQAEENIARIAPEKLVLISTIDVFKAPRDVDENSPVDTEGLQAYGLHRYELERRVRERYPDALIVRLPGLFGKGLKKNFLYDFLHRVPSLLTEKKLRELDDAMISAAYDHRDDGFYVLKQLPAEERKVLRERFEDLGFTALNFTDSRSRYQFYNLGRAWDDIQTALRAGIRLLHPATEPVSAGEVYRFLTGEKFVNELAGPPADYDYRTIYAEVFGGKNGYLCSKAKVLEDIREFVEQEKDRK